MSKENITFRLDSEKRAVLDEIAVSLDRDRTYVLNEAVNLYLEVYQWQIAEIKAGVAEAEAEDFATDEEVKTVFAKLTNAH
ncbi:CopG family ribbon-helix-helix protein [Iningainema tapete]|uniref:CopG family transcriptional regulator n=1 Tax=Iningainema tapete BLCC-T55 TaxID=2748662 RepID=A0A8J7C831_9CYAN|nr:CopG family transcriptional regulator [Iningainema tapete]MBD2776504.1 CopG family transcriptional regulator [Iningainema tapete BLCC-T55]